MEDCIEICLCPHLNDEVDRSKCKCCDRLRAKDLHRAKMMILKINKNIAFVSSTLNLFYWCRKRIDIYVIDKRFHFSIK